MNNCIKFKTNSSLSLSLYGVFDGHGGKKASNYIASKLHHVVANKFPTSWFLPFKNIQFNQISFAHKFTFDITSIPGLEGIDKEMKKCLMDSLKTVDDAYLAEARRQ